MLTPTINKQRYEAAKKKIELRRIDHHPDYEAEDIIKYVEELEASMYQETETLDDVLYKWAVSVVVSPLKKGPDCTAEVTMVNNLMYQGLRLLRMTQKGE